MASRTNACDALPSLYSLIPHSRSNERVLHCFFLVLLAAHTHHDTHKHIETYVIEATTTTTKFEDIKRV